MSAASLQVPVLIPAYEPPAELLETVAEVERLGFARIVVVNDGSSREARPVFEQLAVRHPRVRLLEHAVNLGKGAALKTGLNHILACWPDAPGAVTADADGQHLPDDIVRVAEALCAAEGREFILGARRFGRDVPLRSLLGNRISAVVMRALIGQRLSDTQTGLRGIPACLIPQLLRLTPNGYEFELDALIAAKHRSVPVTEIPIATVYLDGNRASHFNPLWDSMRIYFVFLRFALASLVTALIDNSVFIAVHGAWGNILGPQLAARLVALVFNYTAARRAVFQSRDRHRHTLPRFLVLAAAHITVSYGMITYLHLVTGWRAIPAKLSVEAALFLANFAIQRDFVFTKRPGEE